MPAKIMLLEMNLLEQECRDFIMENREDDTGEEVNV